MARLALIALIAAVPAGAADPKPPEVVWRAESDVPLRGATAAFGLVLAGTDGGELRAFSAETGARVWTHRYASGDQIWHRPAADDERVYYTTRSHLVAVAPDGGRQLWEYALAKYHGSQCVVVPALDAVIAADGDGVLHAVRRGSGDRKWAADFLADAPAGIPRRPSQEGKAWPKGVSAGGEGVYVAVYDQHRVVAFDARTGARRWAYQAGSVVSRAPVPAGKYAVFGCADEHVHCVDAATGRRVWAAPTPGAWVEPAADADGAYFGTADGRVRRVNLADGKPVWVSQTRPHGGRVEETRSPPTLTKDAVIFRVPGGELIAVDRATGARRWGVPVVDKSQSFSPLVTDGDRFFATVGRPSSEDGPHGLVAVRGPVPSR